MLFVDRSTAVQRRAHGLFRQPQVEAGMKLDVEARASSVGKYKL